MQILFQKILHCNLIDLQTKPKPLNNYPAAKKYPQYTTLQFLKKIFTIPILPS